MLAQLIRPWVRPAIVIQNYDPRDWPKGLGDMLEPGRRDDYWPQCVQCGQCGAVVDEFQESWSVDVASGWWTFYCQDCWDCWEDVLEPGRDDDYLPQWKQCGRCRSVVEDNFQEGDWYLDVASGWWTFYCQDCWWQWLQANEVRLEKQRLYQAILIQRWREEEL